MGIDSQRLQLNCGVPSETIFVMDMLTSLPVAAQQIKKWTDRDPTCTFQATCTVYAIPFWREVVFPNPRISIPTGYIRLN